MEADTEEGLFKQIITPIYRRNGGGREHHLIVSIDKKKNKFIANFLAGTGDFYYKKNFTSPTLYGVLEKVYNRLKR